MRPAIRKFATATLLLAAVLALSGCLSAKEQDVVSYDPATDDFRALMILSDIRGAGTDDLDYFARIYRNRGQLIAPSPIPIPIIDPMFLRVSDNECAFVTMFDQPTRDLDGLKTDVPLQTIEITPGSLFTENGQLCYFQAIKIPGKTLDMAVADAFNMALDLIKDRASGALKKELDRRAAGGALKTRPEVTDKLLKGIDETLAPRKSHPAPRASAARRTGVNAARFRGIDLAVLQAKSLQRLKTAIDKKDLHVTRTGQTLSILLPLEPDDARGIEDVTHTVNDHISELLAKNGAIEGDDRETIESFHNSSKAMQFKAQDNGLALQMDLVEMAKAQGKTPRRSLFESLQSHGAGSAPDAQHSSGSPDPLAYARTHNLPLDPALTAQEVIDAFNARNLQPQIPPNAPAPNDRFSISAPKERLNLPW